MRLYKLAAAQGSVDAQYNIALMYKIGHGVAQNNIQAYKWFDIAVNNGDSISSKERDITAAQMTTEQIEQAQKLAKECQARNYKSCD